MVFDKQFGNAFVGQDSSLSKARASSPCHQGFQLRFVRQNSFLQNVLVKNRSEQYYPDEAAEI
jgi:hypothetical protein